MKRKIKKAISIILILALLPSVTQLNVKGQVQNVENTIQINEKPFFEYIEGKPGDLHLVYTCLIHFPGFLILLKHPPAPNLLSVQSFHPCIALCKYLCQKVRK